jgi:glycosyltransferase involved in cell wall biosynthesis
MKPIFVAHLIATNFYGGPEKQIVAHALCLNKEHFCFLLISFIDDGQPNELVQIAQDRGIDVVELHSRNAFDPGTIRRLAQILRNRGINLLCAHGYKANIIGRLASWFAKIPQISVSRGWTAESPKIRVYEKLDKLFLKFADKVVAVSHGQRIKILTLVANADRVVVIHNAINLGEIPEAGWRDRLRQELGLPHDAFIVASAGRLSPEKNYSTMVEVARLAVQHNAKIYFVIFGEGVLRSELEKAIVAADLCEHFLLPGFRKDLQELLHGIDVFMLPSHTEGLPNVVLEAFAVRKPVVATRVGGTPEVVQEGISGFLTKPDESALMAHHIQTLAANPDLCQSMGKAGYEHIQEYFSFEAQTREYEQLYMNMLKARIC